MAILDVKECSDCGDYYAITFDSIDMGLCRPCLIRKHNKSS